MGFITPFPGRGVVSGGPDRLSRVYLAPNQPGWTEAATFVAASPPAAGKTRLVVPALGESGVVGYGLLSDALPAGYPPTPGSGHWTYDATRGQLPLVEPTHGPQTPMTARVGAAGMLCARILSALGSSYEIMLVPCAYGGSKMADWAVGGALYLNAKTSILAALSQPRTVLHCMLLEQGINDAASGAPGYAAAWTAIEAQLRSDVGGTSCPLFVAQQHATVPAGIDPTAWASLRDGVSAYCAGSPLRRLVQKPDGPSVDTLHLATAAQIVLSQRYFDGWTAQPGIIAV
jgi:carbohydrate esterase-like sialic acid-specific acetylesterase